MPSGKCSRQTLPPESTDAEERKSGWRRLTIFTTARRSGWPGRSVTVAQIDEASTLVQTAMQMVNRIRNNVIFMVALLETIIPDRLRYLGATCYRLAVG